jgi:S-adenosylmethionine synthetase
MKNIKEEKRLFTSESVTEGHPDKVCDQISDAILDAILSQDPYARVACETVASKELVLVTGEITTKAIVDYEAVVRQTLKEIGYTSPEIGLGAETCEVMIRLNQQSPDIAQGVDESSDKAIGAGDQGLMFGYANIESDDYMPLPISLAHQLAKRLAEVRKTGLIKGLRPDGKTQVTVEYDEFDLPVRVDTVLISTQHDPEVLLDELAHEITEKVILPIIPNGLVDDMTNILVNPTGRFVEGGSSADVGLTGRKIIVDTYGGYARHGGGAFSGKEGTKVDRSGAYMARYIAKNLVASELADKCEVQLAYAIGVAEPLSVRVDTFGTGRLEEKELTALVREIFDLTPAGMIETLKLRQPIFKQTAAYGHFGNETSPWEQLDKVDILREKARIR